MSNSLARNYQTRPIATPRIVVAVLGLVVLAIVGSTVAAATNTTKSEAKLFRVKATLFDPFKLTTYAIPEPDSGKSLNASDAEQDMFVLVLEGRPPIRIPFRPVIRSPFRPPLVAAAPPRGSK